MAKRVFVATLFAGAVAILTITALPTVSGAAVKPGDFITAKTAYKVKGLVSPGVYWKVVHGMAMKIVPSSTIQWPPPYRDATEKYASQVRLTPDHRSLVGYVAGQPFPLLDPNDPNVAEKIIWNNVFRPIQSDDYDLRYFECQAQYVRPGEPQRVINDTMVGHYAGYSEIGRTEVNPIPVDPDFKKTGRMWLFGLYPILAPENERGAGLIRWRYANPHEADAAWSYTVGARRVRRLNNAILSTSTDVASAWNPDHYSGFNPKTQWYDYKFLGEKDMLACVHGAHSPEITCPYDGGSSICPESWEMRHLYVVEAMPRYSVDNTLQGRNVVYLDSEAWFEPYVDDYNRRGELFQNFLYYLTYRDRPVPDARIAIYPFKREFVIGAVSTDVQGGVASVCYLPSRNSPEHECWYINMGAVSRDFFTPLAMREAAQTGM
jgi:Protein of unknown function (DUF1329)